MFVDTLKTEKFAVVFSFLLGFSLFVIAIPVCKGDECILKKAPSTEEMKETTYKLGQKCYQFRPEIVSCPPTGVIEAFVVSRGSMR
jgi:hypothetical protein